METVYVLLDLVKYKNFPAQVAKKNKKNNTKNMQKQYGKTTV